MDFERKVEIEVLAADREPEVSALLEDSEAAALDAEEAQGPVPGQTRDVDKPSHEALAAWIDDLAEFEVDHAGDKPLFEAAEKLKDALAEDLTRAELARMHEDVSHVDEQEGLIGNFLADTARDDAASHPRSDPADDGLMVATAARRSYIDEDFGGGGDPGGAGGPPGGRTPPAGGGDDEPPADDDTGEKTDAKPDATSRDVGKVAPDKKASPKPMPAAPKPDKKRDS